MVTRRSLAITGDRDLARQFRLALLAAGTLVDAAESILALPTEVPADLVVVHLPDNRTADLAHLAMRLSPEAWIVVVLGAYDLAAAVEAMRASERVALVAVAEGLSAPALAAATTRLLHGDVFGLDKLLPWGTRTYATLVTDYAGKASCIAELSEFAAAVGVRRKYREAIEQCADEMLMNALYDAPVGPDGQPLLAAVATRDRVSVRLDRPVVVQYACDGQSYVLSVRDGYGSFTRETLLTFLHKCLHSEQQIDRKVGGAGLGLYIMANNASALLFNLLPGVATEVIAVFDVTSAKLRLLELAVYNERVDAAGRLVAGPTRIASVPVERRQTPGAPSATSRPLLLALGSAIVLLLAIIGLVAYPRLVPQTGAVEVATSPPGAAIEIDGRLRGTTSAGGRLRVGGLSAASGHRVVAQLEGHADAEALIEVPSQGTASIELTLRPRAATVLVESDPPGAAVLFAGRELGVTPVALTELPPGRRVPIVLRRAGHVEVRREIDVPSPGGQATLSIDLPLAPDVATVRISSEPPGAAIEQNGELLAGLTTPVEQHLVAAGRRHRFRLTLRGHVPADVEIAAAPGERDLPVAIRLTPGGVLTLTANVPARALVSRSAACPGGDLPLSCALENGAHRIRLENSDPYVRHTLDVKVAGVDLRRELRFGIIEAARGWSVFAGDKPRRAIALPPGRHTLALVSAGGEERSLEIEARAGETVTAP
jgi:hypothetical protein